MKVKNKGHRERSDPTYIQISAVYTVLKSIKFSNNQRWVIGA